MSSRLIVGSHSLLELLGLSGDVARAIFDSSIITMTHKILDEIALAIQTSDLAFSHNHYITIAESGY